MCLNGMLNFIFDNVNTIEIVLHIDRLIKLKIEVYLKRKIRISPNFGFETELLAFRNHYNHLFHVMLYHSVIIVILLSYHHFVMMLLSCQ